MEMKNNAMVFTFESLNWDKTVAGEVLITVTDERVIMTTINEEGVSTEMTRLDEIYVAELMGENIINIEYEEEFSGEESHLLVMVDMEDVHQKLSTELLLKELNVGVLQETK